MSEQTAQQNDPQQQSANAEQGSPAGKVESEWVIGIVILGVVALVGSWWIPRGEPDPIAVEPQNHSSERAPRPASPTIPDIELAKAYPVPGLEHIDPAFSPWLSPDLTRIVFSALGRGRYDLYEATRLSATEPFATPVHQDACVTLETEAYPTLTPDSQELVFIRSDSEPRLLYSQRESLTETFPEPVEWSLPDLDPTEQRLGTPQFVDELQVIFGRVNHETQERTLWTTYRSSRSSDFESPGQLPLEHAARPYFVASHGLRAYFPGSDGGFYVVSRSSDNQAFNEPMELVKPAVTGPVEGPFWVAPQEDAIVYCSPGPGQTLGSGRKLWMVQF